MNNYVACFRHLKEPDSPTRYQQYKAPSDIEARDWIYHTVHIPDKLTLIQITDASTGEVVWRKKRARIRRAPKLPSPQEETD